jgi:hypothetical protein
MEAYSTPIFCPFLSYSHNPIVICLSDFDDPGYDKVNDITWMMNAWDVSFL